MSQPQLQPGHWYLVHSGAGHGAIRAYMADGGWYPAHPAPTGVVCEMSRVHHPDNVELGEDGEDFTVSEWDQQVIEAQYPPAATDRQLTRTVRALAQRLCIAAGQEWNPDWVWDPDREPAITDNRHAAFLMIACAVVKQAAGENPVVDDWADVEATLGPPEGIFRPRRWPAEPIAGAVQLARA